MALASLLDAIETIHREKVYHRDIAPDNILILKDGRPLLLDFGAARHVIGETSPARTAAADSIDVTSSASCANALSARLS